MSQSDEWTTVITPKNSLLDLNLKEVYRYRDLVWLFVKRDIVTVYKQTVLGPLWFFIQPIMTTGIFTFVFGNIAKISTDGLPHPIFYMLGIIIWNYFSVCLGKTSNTFVRNQGIFGKVYFPRMIVPLSVVMSNLVKFSIQFLLFLMVFIYYLNQGSINPNFTAFFLPYVVFCMGITGLGFGMLFSSLTTKYRDLSFLIGFSVQLWMYATPVIYSASSIPEKYKSLIMLNPISPLIESMRYGFLGVGNFTLEGLAYSGIFGIAIFFIGLVVFNKVEKRFMDIV